MPVQAALATDQGGIAIEAAKMDRSETCTPELDEAGDGKSGALLRQQSHGAPKATMDVASATLTEEPARATHRPQTYVPPVCCRYSQCRDCMVDQITLEEPSLPHNLPYSGQGEVIVDVREGIEAVE